MYRVYNTTYKFVLFEISGKLCNVSHSTKSNLLIHISAKCNLHAKVFWSVKVQCQAILRFVFDSLSPIWPSNSKTDWNLQYLRNLLFLPYIPLSTLPFFSSYIPWFSYLPSSSIFSHPSFPSSFSSFVFPNSIRKRNSSYFCKDLKQKNPVDSQFNCVVTRSSGAKKI